MPIPAKELVKVSALLNRIEAGRFDANDVDALLIKLRPYSAPRSVFREIADFVAHADARDKGVTWDSMTAFADVMRYFVEYVAPKQPLHIAEPFPIYVYRLFRSQTLLADESQLKQRFRISPQSLLAKIESNFQVNRAAKSCYLRVHKDGVEFLAALRYVTGFIHSRPAFDLADFHRELRALLRSYNIATVESALIEQTDRISLALLCLLSGTEFSLPEGETATCVAGAESHYRILEGKRRTPIGEVTLEPSSLGKLQIRGQVKVISKGKPVTVAYPVVSTQLDPHDHCDPSLFEVLSETNEFGLFRAEFLNLPPHMALRSDFKLVPARG
jgi:hypothetical protein